MPKWTLFVCLAALMLSLVGARGDPSRIELRDGSVISGEVVGFSDGQYLIESPALGRLKVDEAEIRSVQPGSHGADASGAGYGPEIQALQQQLVADPNVIQMISALQNDPDVQAALADPEFMQLVTSGNIDALQANPRFQRLMNHPSMRAIRDRLGSEGNGPAR